MINEKLQNQHATSYKSAGVDIDAADAAKRQMAASLESRDPRVLNRIGAFASLFTASFPGVKDPVLVLKMEEPGSKQKLAFELGKVRSICQDLIHHLINDIAVMGAKPLAVLDAVICGKLEKKTVTELVEGMSAACRAHGCSLVGGETSEQPGVIAAGLYILTASIIGVVDRSRIIDGSAIKAGDAVIGIASNGLHTNGYSLVRRLLADDPKLARMQVDGEDFLEVIMRPHTCYLPLINALTESNLVSGLAHITGGGIVDNLNRIIPKGLSAPVDFDAFEPPAVFKIIQQAGKVSTEDMRRTFNLGVGLAAVVDQGDANEVMKIAGNYSLQSFSLGKVC